MNRPGRRPQIHERHRGTGVAVYPWLPTRTWLAVGLILAVLGGPATCCAAAAGDDLTEAEKRTIRIFKSASAGVVSVANRAVVQDWYSLQVHEIPQGTGSGFVWDKRGHVVTNYHVVHQAQALQVTLRDGNTYEAEVTGIDPDHDLAVLQVRAPEAALVPIPPGVSRTLQVGQMVIAIGNPFGLDTSLSVGVVSALGRTMTSMTDRPIPDVIQTDAAINPGNSGGPLLDSSGRLIGVNAAILSPSGSYAGVGFAVPVDTVKRVVPQLIATGRVRRAGLGVQFVPDHVMASMGVEGVGLLRVVPGGAADKAGMQGTQRSRRGATLGDVLVEIDGTPLKSSDDLMAAVDRHEPGDTVKIVCLRGGQRRSVSVVLQALP